MADPPRLVSLFPSRISERGSAEVLVRGQGFVKTKELACIFQDRQRPERSQTRPARWIGSSLVACPAPPHAPGSVEMVVSVNGQDMPDSALALDYTGAWLPSSIASLSFTMLR